MIQILNTLAPIFLLIVLGLLLRRTGLAPHELFRQTNRLVYWIALPALLFEKTAAASVAGAAAVRLAGVLVGGMVACIAAGYLVARLLRLPRTSAGAFVQASYRGNLAYVGLPVILFSLAGGAASSSAAASAAVVALGPVVPLYNLAAVIVLLRGRGGQVPLWRRAGVLTGKVAGNPLLLACAAGVAWSTWGPAMPTAAARTLQALGQMALPLALLGVGASLAMPSGAGSLVRASAAAVVKVAFGPLAGLLGGLLVGLTPQEMRIALIYLATPTAVMSFVMAEQLGGDARLSADAVVVSTALSLPALVAVLAAT